MVGAAMHLGTFAALSDSATGTTSVSAGYWIADLTIEKVYSDANQSAVSVGISCDGGASADSSPAAPAPGSPAGVSINDIPRAGTTCTLAEAALSNYTAAWTGDCSPDVNGNGLISLAGGDTRSCTVTNTLKTGTLKVVKNVSGGNASPSDWLLHVMQNGSDVVTAAAGTSIGTEYTLPVGSYVVSETGGPSGYTGTFSDSCDTGGNVTVAAGQTVTCTLTNTAQTGTLKVIKTVSGGSALPGNWQLHVKQGANEVSNSPAAGSSSGTEYVLTIGSYVVSETGGPIGYTGAFSGSCDSGGNVTVLANQLVTCTLTNTRDTGSVTITKDADAAGTFGFDLTALTGAGGTCPSSSITVGGAPNYDGSVTCTGIPTGTYTISENAPGSSWDFDSAQCGSDGSVSTRSVSVTVTKGLTTTCTFVNEHVVVSNTLNLKSTAESPTLNRYADDEYLWWRHSNTRPRWFAVGDVEFNQCCHCYLYGQLDAVSNRVCGCSKSDSHPLDQLHQLRKRTRGKR